MKTSKLKLGAIADDKPVKLTIEIPAALHRDLVDYAQVLGRETGKSISEPAKLMPLCWRGLWRLIGHSQRCGARFRRR